MNINPNTNGHLLILPKKHYTNIMDIDEKIVTHKIYTNKGKVRAMSLFKTSLTLFHRAINSTKSIRLPIRFILYDI